VEFSEYILEPLRTDEEFVLYRSWHSDQPSSPSVLQLAPAATRPTQESLRKIEHEYSLRTELDSAWAIRPLALSKHLGQTALVLEDPGGKTLDGFLSGPMEMTQFLRFAVGLATALGEMHKRELIHKDVKPHNVLVNPATGQVRLMGFGIASRLPRERQAPEPPASIAGTLAYMAPEQTGRMNRSIDSRSDLYALGVTLYEMLTGTLPFMASDPMELVHCHIARQPTPPSVRLKGIPDPVSAIIMKMLAKTAEERYQTAAGAESDLRRCLFEWKTQNHIDEFPLGEHDIPDRLLIPEKLYGRESEIEALVAAFDRVVAGARPELVLVSGYSGIGKSSVVNELHRRLVPPRGLFASGKFDQFKRDIPYATLAQAFQSLLRPLLTKSEAELSKWRDALRDALDPNGQLIVNLVPELRHIIGEQPSVPEVSPQDAQRRFHLVFRRFISVFARPDHPLALFLDDLQWLDAATLDLLEDLLTQPDVQYLLLIGAYRDNEVDPSHALVRKLEAIRRAGGTVHEISLHPLASSDLVQLVADSLCDEPEHVASLAHLIHEKTAGNPFFAIQFLSMLSDEGLLAFNHNEGRWCWDLSRIQSKNYTDNVVDLIVAKLSRLPIETQNALQQLACLGDNAHFNLLRMVSQSSEKEVHARLWEAARTGLVFRSADTYRFLHDRVQEAAYSLIPEHSRAEAHLRIGRLLAAQTPPDKLEERIFAIVNQLNRGVALISSLEEREQLAELNLIAGKRAKTSTAYTSALNYLIAGATLLPADAWERRHELTFALELNRAECEFMTGALGAAEQRLNVLVTKAETTIERASITGLRVDLYVMIDQYTRAIAVGLDYLRGLGVEWSPHPTNQDVHREYERIWSQLGSRTIEDLIELPLMTDASSLATMDVITLIAPAAFFTEPNLHDLAVCWAVNLSLERGNSDASSDAYVRLGLIASQRFGDYRAAYRFGQLAYELIEQCGFKRFQARTYHHIATHLIPCAKHVRAARDLLRRSFQIANESGDLLYASYVCNALNQNLLSAGDALGDVQLDFEHALEFVRKVAHRFSVDIVSSQLAYVRNLRGLTGQFGSFDDEQFDEHSMERHFSENPNLTFPEWWYWILKLQAHFHAGDYTSALRAARRVERVPSLSRLLSMAADYHLFSALSHAASCDSGTPEQREEHIAALALHHSELIAWSETCPANFENLAALLGAEIARLEGRELDAERLYEQAIRSAGEQGFIQNEALAYELGVRFYMARGLQTIAEMYLHNARYCYLRWGAEGKVYQLDQQYPQVRHEKPVANSTSTIAAPVEHLDLATVIKVSQAVSGEMVLEKLIDKLMRAAIEHAGAERGLLIVPRSDELQIEAEANTTGEDVTVHLPDGAQTAAGLPESLVRYVMRTRETVLLDDASSQNAFSADPYIVQRRARSILSLPLINQGKLIGILYLENNLTPHVFTPDRMTVLKVLASQAAISLENTRLYRDLEDREARIRRLVEANVVGVVMWTLDGAIIGANEAFLHMVQYSHEDIASGRVRWTDLTPAEWHDCDERAIADLKATGIFQPFEKEYFRKNGSRVPVLLAGALFEGGRSEGVAFVLDLSEQKRAEQERERLRQVEAELAHINRVSTLGEMAASLAHEIKQPIAAAITSANSCIEWLAHEPPNLERARAAAGRIDKYGNRAAEIIDHIRSLYKKSPPRRELVEVNGMIQEMLTLLKGEATRSSIAMRTDLSAELPKVMVDRVQLQQVFMNLMLNAIEAMRDSGGELAVKSELQDGQFQFSVSDTGVGLPTEKMDQIFSAFFTTKPQGSGMGLAISRSIVESHGGRLWAAANDGRGATFYFTLPTQVTETSPLVA
jgi:PAS domain S-box-containing protein